MTDLDKKINKILNTLQKDLVIESWVSSGDNEYVQKNVFDKAHQTIKSLIAQEVRRARWSEVRLMLNIPEPNRKELLQERLTKLKGGE